MIQIETKSFCLAKQLKLYNQYVELQLELIQTYENIWPQWHHCLLGFWLKFKSNIDKTESKAVLLDVIFADSFCHKLYSNIQHACLRTWRYKLRISKQQLGKGDFWVGPISSRNIYQRLYLPVVQSTHLGS